MKRPPDQPHRDSVGKKATIDFRHLTEEEERQKFQMPALGEGQAVGRCHLLRITRDSGDVGGHVTTVLGVSRGVLPETPLG